MWRRGEPYYTPSLLRSDAYSRLRGIQGGMGRELKALR